MPKAAIVLVSYKLPPARLMDWLRWNLMELAGCVPVYVVTDPTTDVATVCSRPPWWRFLIYPGKMPVFSLAKTANFGIRRALEDGCETILKCDPDIIFDGALETMLTTPAAGRYVVAKFHNVRSYAERQRPYRDEMATDGCISMTAHAWQAIQGYDERMYGWGFEDTEVCQRAKESGMQQTNAWVLHVDHPPWGRASGFNPNRNDANFNMPPRIIGSQPDWGKGL
jgi:hypothetical protein